MSTARRPGHLHGISRSQRSVSGFLVTDSLYPPSLTIERHDHELASLCIVLAGGYDESLGSGARRADPGTVIVHPEGEHHANRHDRIVSRVLNIEVDRQRMDALSPATRLFDDSWHGKDEGLTLLAFRIVRDLGDADAVSSLSIEGAVLELMAEAGRARLPDAGGSRWLKRVRDFLEQHAFENPTMADLAGIAGVHPVHLARAFRKAFGCSVGGYVRRLHVARAMILLRDDSLSLSSVAQQAGFTDQSHMTRAVRAEAGLPPGRWRREIGSR